MTDDGLRIIEHLRAVESERAHRTADVALGKRVAAVKQFQHQRFVHTYRDLSTQPEQAAAVKFFLDELYGPSDFARRDAQFARIVPALVRLFPAAVVGTVEALGELHALSESLDTRMARLYDEPVMDGRVYARAWRLCGSSGERERQIELMLKVGTSLARYTRQPVLRHGLRLMRGPAAAAGLSALQQFLESGFETFRALPDPKAFLTIVARRERALAAFLFDGVQLDNFDMTGNSNA